MPIFPYDLQEITSSQHVSSFKKIEMDDDIDLFLCKLSQSRFWICNVMTFFYLWFVLIRTNDCHYFWRPRSVTQKGQDANKKRGHFGWIIFGYFRSSKKVCEKTFIRNLFLINSFAWLLWSTMFVRKQWKGKRRVFPSWNNFVSYPWSSILWVLYENKDPADILQYFPPAFSWHVSLMNSTHLFISRG